jgi:hypothetical protein
MPIDPDTHTLWYDYVFRGQTPEDNTRTEAISVHAWGYQQVVSMSAFLHGMKRKYPDTGNTAKDLQANYRVENHRKYDHHRKVLWIGKRIDEYRDEQQMDIGHVQRYAEIHPSISEYFRTLHPEPTRSFDNVYEFYDHIRYDRKTKKFLK